MTGILGGSYNPVHIGHMIVASWMAQYGGFDKVWLMLSPLNPLKSDEQEAFATDAHRLSMLQIAVAGSARLEVCDVELGMPRPSYTYDTLCELRRRYPAEQFRLIIGSDNWLLFGKWRHSEDIIREFGVTIYPRPGYEVAEEELPAGVNICHAPVVELSSTFIRRAIAAGDDVRYYLPCGVETYIRENGLYITDK